jgi:hypothetical protein
VQADVTEFGFPETEIAEAEGQMIEVRVELGEEPGGVAVGDEKLYDGFEVEALVLPVDGGINQYDYVSDYPVNSVDPLGLYTLNPGVPPPSPVLVAFLNCLEGCIGKQVVVTSTTGGSHQDPGHAAGTSVDIRPPGIPSTTVFCCAGKCGAAWGLKEGQGGSSLKYTNGSNDHFQLFPPNNPSPKAPNQIPPGCKPGGCPGAS